MIMEGADEIEDTTPIFRAVSSSARQLFQLLNCIRFAAKVHVQITGEGIRFAVEDSKVMQGTKSHICPGLEIYSNMLQESPSLTKPSLLLSTATSRAHLETKSQILQTSKFLSLLSSKPFKSSVQQTILLASNQKKALQRTFVFNALMRSAPKLWV
jgi:hypothetical protein